MSQRHLKTWRHVCHFSPIKSAGFDGRTGMRRLVKRCNPLVPFAVKCGTFAEFQHVWKILQRVWQILQRVWQILQHVWQILQHVWQILQPVWQKGGAICIPELPAQIQRQTIKVWCDFLSKSGAQILENVEFFWRCTVPYANSRYSYTF